MADSSLDAIWQREWYTNRSFSAKTLRINEDIREIWIEVAVAPFRVRLLIWLVKFGLPLSLGLLAIFATRYDPVALIVVCLVVCGSLLRSTDYTSVVFLKSSNELESTQRFLFDRVIIRKKVAANTAFFIEDVLNDESSYVVMGISDSKSKATIFHVGVKRAEVESVIKTLEEFIGRIKSHTVQSNLPQNYLQRTLGDI